MSDVLEAVANNERDPYEVVSSEDMLSRVHEANKKNAIRRKDWMNRRFEKLMKSCNSCPNRYELIAKCDRCSVQCDPRPPPRAQPTTLSPDPHGQHTQDVERSFWDGTQDCESVVIR